MLCQNVDLSGDFPQSFSGELYSHFRPKTPLKATAEEASKSSEVGRIAGRSIKAKPGWPLMVRQATIKDILIDAENETEAL